MQLLHFQQRMLKEANNSRNNAMHSLCFFRHWCYVVCAVHMLVWYANAPGSAQTRAWKLRWLFSNINCHGTMSEWLCQCQEPSGKTCWTCFPVPNQNSSAHLQKRTGLVFLPRIGSDMLVQMSQNVNVFDIGVLPLSDWEACIVRTSHFTQYRALGISRTLYMWPHAIDI